MLGTLLGELLIDKRDKDISPAFRELMPYTMRPLEENWPVLGVAAEPMNYASAMGVQVKSLLTSSPAPPRVCEKLSSDTFGENHSVGGISVLSRGQQDSPGKLFRGGEQSPPLHQNDFPGP